MTRRTKTLSALLLIVVVLQFGYPITGYGAWWTVAYMVLYAAMLGFGILSVHVEDEVVAPMVAVTAIFLVAGTWFSLAQESTTATVAMLTSVALSMAALIFALLRFVFKRSSAPGFDLVLAATTAYLVIGGFFAATMTLLEIAVPGSFADPQGQGQVMRWEQLLYYSYVSLSTLGYGDILPTTSWARAYGSFVAVVGTLFLTIVVARLVGIWSSVPTQTSPVGDTDHLS
ncbi:MAG: ion channel [Ornithinimicrobium sp.]